MANEIERLKTIIMDLKAKMRVKDWRIHNQRKALTETWAKIRILERCLKQAQDADDGTETRTAISIPTTFWSNADTYTAAGESETL